MAQTSRGLASDSPSAEIWSVYVAEADRQDRALAEAWKSDMDSLLIFAGLFSASITAFLIESYKTLSPDPHTATIAVLGQISLQLTALANGTQSVFVPADPVQFQPSRTSILCNAFWFLSLAFSLMCALAATLVDQWARAYLSASQKHPAFHRRARIRAYLYEGIQRFGMGTVVEMIPTLLHISLLLFFAGLVEFLYPINAIICDISIAILVVCAILYAVITLLPIFYHHCPYQTPCTSFCWWAWQAIRRLLLANRANRETPSSLSIVHAREVAAVEKSIARNARDEEALRQTLRSLYDDREFETFVEGIPGFLVEDEASVHIVRRLMDDQTVGLGPRIMQRLHLSTYRDTSEKLGTAISCLGATWSILAYCRHADAIGEGIESWFGDEALPVLESFTYEGPLIGHYLSSTIASLSTCILEYYLHTSNSIEHELNLLGADPPWSSAEPWDEQLLVRKYLAGDSPDASSGCIIAFGKWLDRLKHSFEAIKIESNDWTSHSPTATGEFMDSLRSFQGSIHEARITVLNDFLSKVLSDFPPYEALATFYHLVADTNFGLPASLYNQTRLVDFLWEYAEMPRLAYDYLLDLVSVLDDQQLIDEARQVISHYVQLFPDSTSASRALFILQKAESLPPPASVFEVISYWEDS